MTNELNCYTNQATSKALPIDLVIIDQFDEWLDSQSLITQNWLKALKPLNISSGQFFLVPDEKGCIDKIVMFIKDLYDICYVGDLPHNLPKGIYYLTTDLDPITQEQAYLYWGLGAYQFDNYRSNANQQQPAQLSTVNLSNNQKADLENQLQAVYEVRNLINIPAEDMGPEQLAHKAQQIAQHYQANCQITVGQDLLDNNFPAIHRVGRAANEQPRLIDMTWGNHDAQTPTVTLVGKGVCFDTGGLDLKPSSNMRLMKKDMGGAAHVLGLAAMIMQSQLPVRLRVLIPAVDNAVSGNAYRPSDVIQMRNGQYVEVTNTDAEGRLVMADAITLACEESPELLIDFATLTGAARAAVGTDIAAFWTTHASIAQGLYSQVDKTRDSVWQLPLYQDYKRLLKSSIADSVNANVTSPYAGAITAALFLQQFVDSPNTQWLHFDVMGYNTDHRPGHPQGGEAMGMRTVFEWLKQTY